MKSLRAEIFGRRSPKEELGIDLLPFMDRIKKIAGPVRIAKRYDYDSTLFNREFVSLYRLTIKDKSIFPKPKSEKVDYLVWVPIEKVKLAAKNIPELFTKTFLMWLKEAM